MSDLIVVENKTVLEAFSSKTGLDPILEEVTDLVTDFQHDMTTSKGRDQTRALASNVSKLKVRIDDLGKGLTDDWRQKTKAVNDSRNKVKESLDALKLVARKPLTEWEEAQAKKEQEQADREAAEKLRLLVESDHEIAVLLDEKFDRDAAEVLAKIKAEKAEAKALAEKLQLEREAKIAAEAAENAKQEAANKAAREEAAREQAEQNRIAEQQAKDAEASAALERQKAATANAEKEAAAAKQRAAEAEILAKENARREQEAKEAEELRQKQIRETDVQHRKDINNEAVSALVAAGIDSDIAKEVVIAIAKKQIPNVTISY